MMKIPVRERGKQSEAQSSEKTRGQHESRECPSSLRGLSTLTLPATLATDAVHQAYHVGQDPTKGARCSGRAEEEGHPHHALLAQVPLREDEDRAWEQARFAHSEEEPHGEKARSIMHQTLREGDDSEADGRHGHPEGRLGQLETPVAGDLKEDVADEEECQGGGVLIAQLEVRGHPVDLGSSDVASV